MSIAHTERIYEMDAKTILRAIKGQGFLFAYREVRGTRTAETDMCI